MTQITRDVFHPKTRKDVVTYDGGLPADPGEEARTEQARQSALRSFYGSMGTGAQSRQGAPSDTSASTKSSTPTTSSAATNASTQTNPSTPTATTRQAAPSEAPALDEREQFRAELNAVQEGEVFTSVEDLQSALDAMGIEADPALVQAIFETATPIAGYADDAEDDLTFGLQFSALESLIFDQGQATQSGQTTPGVLDLTQNGTGGYSLALGENATAFDRFRFGWTQSANGDALTAQLQAAGYTLTEQDVNALRWFSEGFGDNQGRVTWDMVRNWAVFGALNLGPTDASSPPGVVNMDAAIDLALTGGTYSRVLPPFADLGSNTAEVDTDYLGDSALRQYSDDTVFSQELLNFNGLTVHPTQLGLYRNTYPAGAQDGAPTLTPAQLAEAYKNGTLGYELTDDGQVILSLTDPQAALKDAIGAAPPLANGAGLTADQVVGVLNGLTGTQPSNLGLEDAQWLIAQYGDVATGTITSAQLLGAVDAGTLAADVDPTSKAISIAVHAPDAPGSGDGAGVGGTVTGTVFAAGIRTPVANGGGLDSVFNTNLMDPAITNLGQFAQRYHGDTVYVCGATQFRANELANGQIQVEMALTGTNQWATVFTGGRDSVVKSVETYEWDVGGTASVTWKDSTNGDSSTSGSLGEYSRLKIFRTFWVFEKDQGSSTTNSENDLDNKSFRSRTYFPYPVLTETGGTTNGEPGGSVAGNYWVDLRWGRMDGPPNPADPGRMVEVGVNFNVGVSGAFNLIKHAAEGDWDAVQQDAISTPKLGVTLALWEFGLFGLKAQATTVANRIAGDDGTAGANGADGANGAANGGNNGNAANAGSRWYRTVPAAMVRYLGDTLQHWGLVATVGVQGFATGRSATAAPGTDPTQPPGVQTQQEQVPGSVPDWVPPEFASLFSFVDGMPDLGPAQAAFDALENIDLSQFTDVIESAQTAIQVVSALKEVMDLMKSRGLSALQDLDQDGQNKLFDLVMEEATRLMLEDSTSIPGVPDGGTSENPLGAASASSTQGSSLLMKPGETPQQYAARLMSAIAAKLPEAARNVMLDSSNWDDLQPNIRFPQQPEPTPTEPTPPTSGGGGGAGGIGAGAGAGLGGIAGAVGGAIGAIAGGVALIDTLLGGTDGAEGDPASSGLSAGLVQALNNAKEVLSDSQALLELVSQGGDAADVDSIAEMQARCQQAITDLNNALAADTSATEEQRAEVSQVVAALERVNTDLETLLGVGGELADEAVNNMLGLPDGTAQFMPDSQVQQLLAQDPAIARALWDAGFPPDLIVRIAPKMRPDDLQIDGFVDVLAGDLLTDTPQSVTDDAIDQAILHARFQSETDVVQDLIDIGFTAPQLLTARTASDLQTLWQMVSSESAGGALFELMKHKMEAGWTVPDFVDVGNLVQSYPGASSVATSDAASNPFEQSASFISKALSLMRLSDVRDASFMDRLGANYRALSGEGSGMDLMPSYPIERAIINTRYEGYAQPYELEDARFFQALYIADAVLQIRDPQAAVDYARGVTGPILNPDAPVGTGTDYSGADPATQLAHVNDVRAQYGLPPLDSTDIASLPSTTHLDPSDPNSPVLSIGELAQQQLYNNYRAMLDSGQLAENDPRAQYVRAIEALSALRGGFSGFLPYYELPVAFGNTDRKYPGGAENPTTYNMSARDVAAIIDETAVKNRLVSLATDPTIQADYAAALRSQAAGQPSTQGLADTLYGAVTSDAYAQALATLRADGLGSHADKMIQTDLNNLAVLDPEKANAAAQQLSASGLMPNVTWALNGSQPVDAGGFASLNSGSNFPSVDVPLGNESFWQGFVNSLTSGPFVAILDNYQQEEAMQRNSDAQSDWFRRLANDGLAYGDWADKLEFLHYAWAIYGNDNTDPNQSYFEFQADEWAHFQNTPMSDGTSLYRLNADLHHYTSLTTEDPSDDYYDAFIDIGMG